MFSNGRKEPWSVDREAVEAISYYLSSRDTICRSDVCKEYCFCYSFCIRLSLALSGGCIKYLLLRLPFLLASAAYGCRIN
jgi:hypothetical protein